MTLPEHFQSSIRIYRNHVTTPQGHKCNEPQHITSVFQCGDLIIGAMTTDPHNPDDEGCSRHRRSKDYGGESITFWDLDLDLDLEHPLDIQLDGPGGRAS